MVSGLFSGGILFELCIEHGLDLEDGNGLIKTDLDRSLSSLIASPHQLLAEDVRKSLGPNSEADVVFTGGESHHLSVLVIKRNSIPYLFFCLGEECAKDLANFPQLGL